MIKRLAHVCFVVKDLEASLAFYQDVLGLKLAFDGTNEQGRRFRATLCAGGSTFIELFQGEPEQTTERQSYRHFSLEADDVQSTTAELRASGVEVSDPKVGTDGSWQAWLTDPDGNQIELQGYTPRSKQSAWVD